jgi:hypothetical protein
MLYICFFNDEFYEGSSLTLHAAMISDDSKGFVWVTDRLASLGYGYATLEKIMYLQGDQIACSIWGDHIAMHLRDKFIDGLRSGKIALANRPELQLALKKLAEDTVAEHQFDQAQPLVPNRRGMLLAVLAKHPPCIA